MKDDNSRKELALFRMAVLGDLIHTKLRRGARKLALEKKAKEMWLFPDGESGLIPAKTIESWALRLPSLRPRRTRPTRT